MLHILIFKGTVTIGAEKPALVIQFTDEKRNAESNTLFQEPELCSRKLYVKNSAFTRSVFSLSEYCFELFQLLALPQ